jgi:hypothetical protein
LKATSAAATNPTRELASRRPITYASTIAAVPNRADSERMAASDSPNARIHPWSRRKYRGGLPSVCASEWNRSP